MLAAGSLQRPQAVATDTGSLLAETIQALPLHSTVLIDCRQVSFIDHHAMEPLSKAISEKKTCLILSDTNSIANHLDSAMTASHKTGFELGERHISCFGPQAAPAPEAIARMLAEAQILEKQCVTDAVRTSIVAVADGRLASTPVRTTIAYNARTILACPPQFIWTSLLLADELRGTLATMKGVKKPVVLAVSLRASPFAVAASQLNSVSCEIVDHMGPTPKILEDQLSIGPRVNEECIYIGDFCIGGTELRIAQTYAYLRGRALRRAIVIGCLVCEGNAFPGIDVRALVDLRVISPHAKYEL